MKNILFLTDFSENAWNALKYTISLYENIPCKFYILNSFSEEKHGLDSLNYLDPYEAFHNSSANNSNKKLEQLLNKLAFFGTDAAHEYFMIAKSGSLLNATQKLISQLDIDEILIAAKGDSNKKNKILGRNTKTIIKNINKLPILIVPNTCNSKPTYKIQAKNISFADLKNTLNDGPVMLLKNNTVEEHEEIHGLIDLGIFQNMYLHLAHHIRL